MSNEWKDLPTITDVGEALASDMEIEIFVVNDWFRWTGRAWDSSRQYRARPRKPAELVRVVFSDNGTTSLYRAREPERKFKDCPDAVWDKHLSQNQVQELLKNPYGLFSKPAIPAMKKANSLCYRADDGSLLWGDLSNSTLYKRFPAGDIEGEVEA